MEKTAQQSEVEQAILKALTKLTGFAEADVESALQRLINPAEAGMPEACREHKCGYYEHYLVYYNPENNGERLAHQAFHAAEKSCEEAQNRAGEWLERHKNDSIPFPKALERQCEFWERKVCA